MALTSLAKLKIHIVVILLLLYQLNWRHYKRLNNKSEFKGFVSYHHKRVSHLETAAHHLVQSCLNLAQI